MPKTDTPTPAPAEPAAPVAPAAEAAPALPDLSPEQLAALLDRYAEDPDKRAGLTPLLRSNRFVAGIAGEVVQRDREAADSEAARKAIEAEHESLRKMAKEDPLAFSEMWLSKDDLEAEKAKTAGLRAATRKEFVVAIGNALKDLPEAADFTPDDRKEIAEALIGLDEDAVVPAFNKLLIDKVAAKRADKRVEADIQKRLAAERKVWEAEQKTARLKARPTPDMATPPAPSATDNAEPDWRDVKAYDAWYRKNVLRRAS